MTRTRGGLDARLIVAGLSAVVLCVSCGSGKPKTAARRAAATDSGAVAVVRDTTKPPRDTVEFAGETIADSAAPAERWITDANVFSLFAVLNSRTIAAADVELQGWHSEPVRAFASMIAREHAELQHSADSLSERDRIVPVAPALAGTLAAQMRAQVDSMTQFRPAGVSLDRAFVREQIGSHQFMLEYTQRLASVAERSDVQAFLATAMTRLATHLDRARALQATFAAADSTAAADSARRSSRRRP